MWSYRINLTVHFDFLHIRVVSFILFGVVGVRLLLWGQVLQVLGISKRTILVLNDSCISVRHLIESRLDAVDLAAPLLIVWQVVGGVAACHLDFQGVCLPLIWVLDPPFLLLEPVLNIVWVRIGWHFGDNARSVPYLILEVGILIIGRLTGPLADGLVIVAVREVVVDLDWIVHLQHFPVIVVQ